MNYLKNARYNHSIHYLERLENIQTGNSRCSELVLDSMNEMFNDIHFLINNWFCALEDEGCDPWEDEDCIKIAQKYGYTRKDYQNFLNTIC